MNRARTAGLGFVVLFALALVFDEAARALPSEPIGPMGPNQEFGLEMSFISNDPIPRDGAIGLKFKLVGDPTGREQRPIVQLSRPDPNDPSTTLTIAGTLRQVADDYWAWTAIEPLELGNYTFSAAHLELGTITTPIVVVESVALEPPAVSLEQTNVNIAWRFAVTEYAVCGFSDGAGGFFDGTPFPIREEGLLLLQTRLALVSDGQLINQFLYRTYSGPFDFTTFRAASELLETGPLTPRVGEHCAQLEAISLATGDRFAYPDIQVCASYAGGEDLRASRLITSNQALSRYNCMRPPEGYEDEWCKDNEQCISIAGTPGLIDVNNCHDYYELCPDAERPDAGPGPGMFFDGGIGMTVTDGGERDGSTRDSATRLPGFGDAGEDEPMAGSGGSSGCSVAQPRGEPQRSLVIAALALLIVGARGRRRYC